MELTLSLTEAPSAMESRKQSPIKDSQQPQDISFTRRKVGAPLGIAPVNKSPSHRPDLIGKRFGSVKIISPNVLWLGAKSRRFIHVICECETCGYRSVISLSNLEGGRTKGCRTCNQPAPEYPLWLYARVQAMRARCRNPNDANYPRYGARGVEFRFDGVKAGTLWIMKNLGIPDHPELMQLDRADPEGHYEPGNIRWLTVAQNQLNKRGNQAVARMHKFRLEHPEIHYSDSTLKRFFWSGMTDAQVIERFRRPSSKPKGKYGTYSTPDPTIASLVRDS